MTTEVSFGKACCAARYGISGKQRNVADEPSVATEGRDLIRPDSVVPLNRCAASLCGPRLGRTEKLSGQM